MPVIRECATVSGSTMMEYGRKSGESLKGQVALVTGSAKRLGRAVALRLPEEGADVVVHYRTSSADAQSPVPEIAKLGRQGFPLPAHMADGPGNKLLFYGTETHICHQH